MRGTLCALFTLVVTLGSPRFAPGAARGPAPARLLPVRSVRGPLSLPDFPGESTELCGSAVRPDLFATACQFLPPEAGQGMEIGLAELDVYDRFAYERTRGHNLLSPAPAGARVLRGIGTRAYWRINATGDSEGWLQIRNDVFTVDRGTAAGMTGLLARVARALCRGCR